MAGRSRRKKRRFMMRRKRTLDPNLEIDYKNPDLLKRFITDRGKIIPRRISGATSRQQIEISRAVKRARYLALIPFSVAHRPERGFAGEMAAVNAAAGYKFDKKPFPQTRPQSDAPRDGGEAPAKPADTESSDS